MQSVSLHLVGVMGSGPGLGWVSAGLCEDLVSVHRHVILLIGREMWFAGWFPIPIPIPPSLALFSVVCLSLALVLDSVFHSSVGVSPPPFPSLSLLPFPFQPPSAPALLARAYV